MIDGKLSFQESMCVKKVRYYTPHILYERKLHHPNLSCLLGAEQLEASIAILTPLV